VVPESGPAAALGDHVTIHYTARVAGGEVFDSSLDRGVPVTIELGGGQTLAGLEEGLLGMRQFGRRRLNVPADLGFGEAGAPPDVPPGARLVFEVEVLGLEKPTGPNLTVGGTDGAEPTSP